jgi:hypothetical protein
MRSKILIILLISGIIFSTTLLSKNPINQDIYSEEQAIKMLKNFYVSYITEASSIEKDWQIRIDSIQRIYCSIKLINEVKKRTTSRVLDYDPFLNSNNCNTEYLKTLSIKKDSIRKDIYYVSYIKPWNDKEKVTIKLVVVKEEGRYKIACIIVNNLTIGC